MYLGLSFKIFLAQQQGNLLLLTLFVDESSDSHVITCFLELGPLSKYPISRDLCQSQELAIPFYFILKEPLFTYKT